MTTTADAQTEEAEPSTGCSRHQAFALAKARWHRAMAQLEDPSDPENEAFVLGTFLEERAALRELYLVPAASDEVVWNKLAAFEVDLIRERIVGEAKHSLLLLGLGSIKADLMNLRIGKGEGI